jgi:GNAT superfamily N-acetyltransferase
MDILLRRLEATDLQAAYGLSVEAAWPHRLEDWHALHEVGRGVVACDGSGAIVGTAMSWTCGPRAGTLGMVLVSPMHQGKGIGSRLMRPLLDDAGARSLILNATDAGLRLYAACGFRVTGAIRQFQGLFRPTAGATAARPVQPDDRGALLALDEAAFGAPRTAVLDKLMQDGRTMVIGAQAITGFAIRRKFGRGEVIGPVVAACEEDAIDLVTALVVPGFLRIDVPVTASRLITWLTDAGLVDAGGATTMMRGAWPAAPSRAQRFALISQALG